MADAFPIGGSIDPATFPFLLANLHQQAATGSLKVNGPSYQKALYFRGGRVLFGSSNDPHDQLGAILIESGRLSAEQLEAATAKVGPGSPLAKVLADGGLVSQRDLADAARAKVERILCDLFVMTVGSFEFEDDVLPKGAIDLKLFTPRLFVAALRRVPQRDFVERHLGGLDVVLRPTTSAGERLRETFADVAGLSDAFDGRRTLREAAALARLDPFDAAKAACALLFLGSIEKASEAAPTFEAIESEADEFDLAATTRITFDFAPASEPAREPVPDKPDEGETPFFLPGEPAAPTTPASPPFQLDPSTFQATPESEATMRMPAPDAATVSVPPPAPAPAPAEPAAEPTVVLHAPLARGGRADLPLVPPPPRVARPARPAPPRADEPEPVLEPAALSPRPSREDLEALDSLLNARSLEAPLAGSTKPDGPPAAAPRRLPAWEPSFGRDAPVRGAPARGRPAAGRARAGRSSRSSRGRIGLAALALLAVAGGAWYWFGRSRPPAVRPGVGVVKPLTLPGAAPAPAPSPSIAATAAPPVSPPPEAADAATTPPPALPEAARGAAPARTQTASANEARALLRRGDLTGAGRGFVGTLKAAPRGAFSIQLLLACAPETVTKAVASAGAPELFIVPIRYQGRDCYRVCWGLYEGRAQAESARRSVPSYFRAGGTTPKVVPAVELLP
jgi:hypothetical protein